MDLLTAEYGRHRATDTLTELVGPDLARRAIGEPGYGRLMSAVRSMELAGHDPRAVLTEAVARGSLPHAHSVSDVLGYRIRLLDNGGRTPERAVRDGDWTTFSVPWAGPVGDYEPSWSPTDQRGARGAGRPDQLWGTGGGRVPPRDVPNSPSGWWSPWATPHPLLTRPRGGRWRAPR